MPDNNRGASNVGETPAKQQITHQPNIQVRVGVVQDVILNESHPAAKGPRDIGAILFKAEGITVGTDITNFPKAFPLDPTIRTIPTKNELVNIHFINQRNYIKMNFPMLSTMMLLRPKLFHTLSFV